MDKQDRQEILDKLKGKLTYLVCDTLNWPKSYCENSKNVRAIVLGCDPSNQHSHKLKYAFGITTKVPRLRGFFRAIESNLDEIGLSKKVVYVQNLCQNYFTRETEKNSLWNTAAEIWIPFLKNELAAFPDSIPVLLTAEGLYKLLLNA